MRGQPLLDDVWWQRPQRLLDSSLHAAGKVVAALADSLEYTLACTAACSRSCSLSGRTS